MVSYVGLRVYGLMFRRVLGLRFSCRRGKVLLGVRGPVVWVPDCRGRASDARLSDLTKDTSGVWDS